MSPEINALITPSNTNKRSRFTCSIRLRVNLYITADRNLLMSIEAFRSLSNVGVYVLVSILLLIDCILLVLLLILLLILCVLCIGALGSLTSAPLIVPAVVLVPVIIIECSISTSCCIVCRQREVKPVSLVSSVCIHISSSGRLMIRELVFTLIAAVVGVA